MKYSPLFHLDPLANQRKLQRFESICGDDQMLLNCYKNRLEIGCKYGESIENKLDVIHKIIMKREGPPWWVSLLD